MPVKIASLAYVPPPNFGCATVFLDNLRKFKARYPVIVYSDHGYDYPGLIRLKGPMEIVKGGAFKDGKPNKFAVPNLTFFTGLRIAQAQGYTHFCFLESDCRVGCDWWDERIFEEFFGMGRPLIAAGSLACFNPCSAGTRAALRWADIVAKQARRGVPVATYGWVRADQPCPSCVFPNGALAVYSVEWCLKFWDVSNTPRLACETTAYDMSLGQNLWQHFDIDSYEVVGYLESIFSGYGNALTTEDERLEMLRSGKVVAIHQVKSNATI